MTDDFIWVSGTVWDIHVPQKMIPCDFGETLTCPVASYYNYPAQKLYQLCAENSQKWVPLLTLWADGKASSW